MGTGKTILVTGGAGYVGTAFIPQALQQGYKVRVIDNLMFGGYALMPSFLHPNFEFIRGDVLDGELMKKALEDADLILHLAAIVGYPACKQDPELAEKTNVGGTLSVLEHRRKDQPIIYASTGSNYGAVIGEICTEETPLNPLTVYGKTKTEAERLLLEAGNVVCYRFATAFGISARMRLDLLINDFTYKAVKERNLIIYEKTFKRTFIHVFDIARSFLFSIDNLDKMRDQVFNTGNDEMNYSKEEICYLLKEKIDFYLHFAEIGEDEDKRNYEVSYEKIHKLGFDTTITVQEGIDQLIHAYSALDLKREYSNV